MKTFETEVTGNMYGEEKKCVKSFGGETGSTRRLGRTRHSLDHVKMEQKEVSGVVTSETF
jgi:hypothetical protein